MKVQNNGRTRDETTFWRGKETHHFVGVFRCRCYVLLAPVPFTEHERVLFLLNFGIDPLLFISFVFSTFHFINHYGRLGVFDFVGKREMCVSTDLISFVTALLCSFVFRLFFLLYFLLSICFRAPLFIDDAAAAVRPDSKCLALNALTRTNAIGVHVRMAATASTWIRPENMNANVRSATLEWTAN